MIIKYMQVNFAYKPWKVPGVLEILLGYNAASTISIKFSDHVIYFPPQLRRGEIIP